MNFKQSVEWTRKQCEQLNIGGVWAVPRSGLVFARTKEKEMQLIDAMPFDAFMGQAGPGIPESREELIKVQVEDFRQIAERMIAAGFTVTSEVLAIQPISFDLSK